MAQECSLIIFVNSFVKVEEIPSSREINWREFSFYFVCCKNWKKTISNVKMSLVLKNFRYVILILLLDFPSNSRILLQIWIFYFLPSRLFLMESWQFLTFSHASSSPSCHAQEHRVDSMNDGNEEKGKCL